ncbi:MAG: hypothetical protein E7238_09635 [Sarcina sp.]|nr:hypothetical protein [Sarcina sp.]
MTDRFEHFTLSIFSISRFWNRLATEEMKKYGFRGAYALYLVMIASADGNMTAAALADLCQRDKADVSRAISAFRKKGILEPYGESRYRAALKLTEKGQSLAAAIRSRADEVLEQAGRGISDEMRENMYLCLDIIARNMRQICDGETDTSA